MRFFVKNFAVFIAFTALSAFTRPMHTVTIEIKNVKFNLGGTLYLMLVDKNDTPVQKITRAASEKNAVFTVKDLPEGQYAVRAFHDQNNNGELDKGIFGQPIEGWGVSNDARGFMSAPPFQKMLVMVKAETRMAFRMDY
jgi:uncharacterized protein (DUF2141 family)